jgi:hypothetical protein
MRARVTHSLHDPMMHLTYNKTPRFLQIFFAQAMQWQ